MDIRNHTPNYNFKALRISPAPDKWNQQVLNSVLHSNYVRNIIEKDMENNLDTFISFAERHDEPVDNYHEIHHMLFNVVGNKKDITLGSHFYRYYQKADNVGLAALFSRTHITERGSKNLEKTLSQQIQDLDKSSEVKNRHPLENVTIEKLRKFVGEIIIDEPRDYTSLMK